MKLLLAMAVVILVISVQVAVADTPVSTPTLATMQALAAGTTPVQRLGYAAPGDGGAAFYNWSASLCSIAAGAGDNGYQVKPRVGTGCWIADFDSRSASVRVWGAACDGSTDDSAAINAAASSSVTAITFPIGCYVASTLTIPAGVSLLSTALWGGGLASPLSGPNFTAVANILLNPAATIQTGGPSASIDGLRIVNSKMTVPTNLRQLITAVNTFAGTAITCNQPDFAVRNSLIIGFGTAVSAVSSGSPGIQCDRLVVDQLKGDNTNGIVFAGTNSSLTASADVPRLTNVLFNALAAYQTVFAELQSTSVSNAADNGRGQIRLTFVSAPATPFVTGDLAVVAAVGGVTAANGRWTVTAIDPTHIDLQGSSFSGSYTSDGTVYLNGTIRTGKAFSVVNAATEIDLTNYFEFGYDTGFYAGTGSNFVACVNCSADMFSVTLDPTPIAIDLEGDTTGNTFVGGVIGTSGTGLKLNTTDPSHAAVLSGVGLSGGLHVAQILAGSVTMYGGYVFPIGSAADFNIAASAGPASCLIGVAAPPLSSMPFTGATSKLSCPAQVGASRVNYPAAGTGLIVQSGVSGTDRGGQLQLFNTGGGSNPHKTLRVTNIGDFQLMNDAYTAAILDATDDGDIISARNLVATGRVAPAVLGTATSNTLCYNSEDIGGHSTISTCSSLRALQDDIRPLEIGLPDILKLLPVSYRSKTSERQEIGLIAEDVEKEVPILSTYVDGKLSGVDYMHLTALLVKAVQQQQRQLDELKRHNYGR